MFTYIFDIDGTLTDLWPIERATLLAMGPKPTAERLDRLKADGINNLYKLYSQATKTTVGKGQFTSYYREAFITLRAAGRLPVPAEYRIVSFIRQNLATARPTYATGGLTCETDYVLEYFGLKAIFDLENSTSADTCRFSKRTGRPFRKIQATVGRCCLITDSQADVEGAKKAGIDYRLLAPNDPMA